MTEKILALPKPIGPFQVGRTHLNFVDETRGHPSPLSDKNKRDIPLLIWYPIDNPGTSPPLKFLKHQDLISFQTIYKYVPDTLCNVVTNSYKDTSISDKLPKFPVLIFNHGLTTFMEQSSILMEHLASNGYIVVSIGHPYDGVASYPDGRSIPLDANFYKDFFNPSDEDLRKEKEYLDQIRSKILSFEQMKMLIEKLSNLNHFSSRKQSIKVWVEDVLFITDILERMSSGSIQTQFKHKLALEKGIGLFGHSLGGITASLACSLNKRFKCAINIDGPMYNALIERYQYNKPHMFMYSENNKNINRYFYTINKSDSYSVTIKNSTHFDFMDTGYFYKILLGESNTRYGTIDSDLMIKITNDYVFSFFNKYIKETTEKTLESNPYEIVSFEWHQ